MPTTSSHSNLDANKKHGFLSTFSRTFELSRNRALQKSYSAEAKWIHLIQIASHQDLNFAGSRFLGSTDSEEDKKEGEIPATDTLRH
jgi:hypothetical protein